MFGSPLYYTMTEAPKLPGPHETGRHMAGALGTKAVLSKQKNSFAASLVPRNEGGSLQDLVQKARAKVG